MKFSVIIPVYKVEKYLDECVRSVLAQTYNDFEVILVDDGSPDNCPAMCDAYAEFDSRVKVIHKPNGGLSDARNAGLREAKGDFIAFLDSDDYWIDLDALNKAARLIESEPEVDAVLFKVMHLLRGQFIERKQYDAKVINQATLDKAVEYLISISAYNVSACAKFIRRTTLVNNNVIFSKGRLSEDFDWDFTLFAHVRRLKALEDAIYVYRRRDGSITNSITDKHLNDIFWTVRKWNEYLPKIYQDQKLCRVQKNQLGFIYAMLISLSYHASDPHSFLKEIKPYSYLLDYDLNPKTYKVKRMFKLIGLYPTSFVLSMRNRWNRRGIK